MYKVSSILACSVAGAFVFAVIGIVLGLLSESKMILFDGLYSIISLLLALLSLYVSKFINKPNYKSFPFGKYIFQPLMVILSSSVLITLGIIGIVNSVGDMLDGGREIDTGLGLLYGVMTFVGCSIIAFILYKNKSKSELIKSEFIQWFMDSLLSMGIIIGFLITLMTENTSISWLSKYIDPIMVTIAGIFILFLASRLFISNLREVLSLPPSDKIQSNIINMTDAINKQYNILHKQIHVSKMGEAIYIDLVNFVNENSKVDNVDEMDEYNKVYREKMQSFYDGKLWLNIVFTKDDRHYLKS